MLGTMPAAGNATGQKRNNLCPQEGHIWVERKSREVNGAVTDMTGGLLEAEQALGLHRDAHVCMWERVGVCRARVCVRVHVYL